MVKYIPSNFLKAVFTLKFYLFNNTFTHFVKLSIFKAKFSQNTYKKIII